MFFQEAGDVKVTLSCREESCVCCMAAQSTRGILNHDAGVCLFATIVADGDAMPFWSVDTLRTGAPLQALGCEKDLGLSARDLDLSTWIYQLEQTEKLCYSARVEKQQRSCDGDSTHTVTFTVYLSLCFFNITQASSNIPLESQRLLHRLLSRFTAPPTCSSVVERNEILSMRKAAKSLGQKSPENASMNAFLDLPPLPAHVQSLQKVLQSILQPICSTPRALADFLPQGKERQDSMLNEKPIHVRLHLLPDEILVNLLNFLEPR